MLLAMLELRHPARYFLPQCERCGVLQMGAANLDDVFKGCGLVRQRGAQLLQGRQQPVRQRLHRGQVHSGGKDIVARLALVHIVVGVHQAPLAARSAQQLAGAVGQHLVHVHVGLGARAGLPYHQRKLLQMAAFNHLVGRRHNGRGRGGIQQFQRIVHIGAGALDLGQGTNQLRRHALARNIKMLQRALGLRAPQALGGHFDGTKAVFFGADCGRVGSGCHHSSALLLCEPME